MSQKKRKSSLNQTAISFFQLLSLNSSKVTRSSRQYTFLFKFLFFLLVDTQKCFFFFFRWTIQFHYRFETNKSTKGASKLRRDLINSEIANLRDLLPLPQSTRQRLSQLQLMALVCVYVRKANYFQQGKYAFINRMEYEWWVMFVRKRRKTFQKNLQVSKNEEQKFLTANRLSKTRTSFNQA